MTRDNGKIIQRAAAFVCILSLYIYTVLLLSKSLILKTRVMMLKIYFKKAYYRIVDLNVTVFYSFRLAFF